MMINYCLVCEKQVGLGAEYPDDKDGIDPDYEGVRIHYGRDWYCGPVIVIDERNIPEKPMYESITQEIYE